MKKKVLISIVMVIMLVCSLTVNSVFASDLHACQHHFIHDSTDYHGYGSRHYHVVQYCTYVHYSHRHYYLGGTATYVYVCEYCGEKKELTMDYTDYEAGDYCTLHDVGR